MKFPVDLLADVSQAELEQSAHNYMNNLLYSNPDSPEHLTLSDSTKVTIAISSVGLVPLYGDSDQQRILALYSPTDLFTAVALYLLDRWWTVEDILKTADPARHGVVEVETLGERIVLYILNRVIYRAKEICSDELPFLCHGEKDYAKIRWNNGEAVGFYSVKPSGSLCNSFSTRSYQLPVMDSIFVRKCHRGKGFGLQMLEDFVLSFKEDLGLRYPLTKAMYKVCEKYLRQYPEDTDLLWEVESVGGPCQRTNIASKIQTMDLSAVSKNLSFMEESLVITEVTEKDVVMEAITTQIKEAGSVECTVEIVEEVTVRRATKVSEADDVPVAARSRSSGSKRRKTGEKITEDKSEKVIRIEDIEAETPREEHVSEQQKNEVHNVSELVQTESVLSMATEEKGDDEADNAAEEFAPTVTDTQDTVLTSQDLEEAGVTLEPAAEESQVEDDGTQDLKNTSCDSQITVENVASELEGAEEESQEEDTAVLVVSEDVLEVYKKEETLDKVEAATQGKVSDENSDLSHVVLVPLSTRATSEGGEAGKTGRTVGKTIKTVQREIPRRRSQRHNKPEEGVKEETTAQDGRKVLSGRTVVNSPAPTCKYHQHSQKVCEELDKEIDEVAQEKEPPTPEVVEESTVTEGQEAEETATGEQNVVAVAEEEEEEMEQFTNEEEIEKHKEPGAEDTDYSVLQARCATELPDRKENSLKVKEDEKVTEAETSVIEDKAEDSDDEIEEPPVVQRRALRGRCKVTPKPKPTKQSKRHQQQEEKHTNEADLGAGGSAREEEADEKVQEHGQVEQDKMTDKSEEIPAEKLTAVGEGGAPKAGEEEDFISSAEVNVERKVVQEEENTEGVAETVTVVEEADAMIQEPDTVTVASEIVMPNKGQDETVAEELQENDTGSEIPKLQKATVILVDLKTSCHHFSVKEAEETPAAGECAAPEKEQMEPEAEERDVSTSVAEEQTPEPDKLAMEEKEGGTQDNITEKSFNTTGEAETEKLKEDNSEKEKEEIPNVDEKETEEEEVPVIETRVLRSGSKTVEASRRSTSRSKQQQEEGKAGEDINEKEAVEKETDIVEVEGEMEAVEEKPPAISETDADTEVDIPVGDDAEQNLVPAEVDKVVTLDALIVETRALRSGTKTVTATPSNKTARSRKQEEEQDEAVAENSEEEPAVTTRSLRRGRISTSGKPKGKSQRTLKQIQRAEDEEAGSQAAIEKTDKEMEEKTEEEIGKEIKEETASKKEEGLEPEAEVEEGKAVAETLGDREVEVEECNDEGKPVEGGEEVEPPPVAETRALRSGGKTIKAPPKTRSKRSKQQQDDEGGASVEKSTDENEPPAETRILRRGRKSVIRSSKQLQKEEEAPKELTAEEAEVEGEVEAGVGSAEKPLTEDDKGKATEEHKVEVEKEECVAVEVEQGVSEEGTMTMTEGEENTAGEATAADDAVQEGKTDPPLAKPAANSAILTPCEEEAPSAEEQQSEEPQLSDLQRVTVVLVDLKKTYHEVQEETATVEEGPKENTAAKEEVEQRELMEEESMAEEHVPGSPVGTGETKQEEVVVQEEGLGETVEDAVKVHNTGEGSTKETAKVDETKSVDEEEEPSGIKTRTQRSGKEAVKATPRRKSARNRKDDVQHKEEEAASENSEEELAVRVLRRGRKSFTVTQRHATKRTHKQLQEEEEGEESIAVEEREAKEQEEQVEEQQQMIDQEKEEGLHEEEDMTPQVENIEPEMGIEKEDTVAEEAVTQQNVPEEGQASSSEINEEEAPAGESADEGETLDDVAEKASTTQGTVEAEQSTSTSEVDDTAAGESTQETLLTAKDDETKSVSEEEEAPVVEARVMRSGGKTVRATTRRETTKIQDEEAAEEKNTEEDEPMVEARVLRRGRKSAPATPRRKSKRARTQLQTEEEREEGEKEANQDQKIEEKDEEQKEGNTEPEVEMEKVEPVAEVSLTEQETVEEEQSAVAETSADEQGETVGESAEETPPTDERMVTNEEETPVVETPVLRSGGKTTTPKSKKGRKSAPATPRCKSKRACTQLQTEEEGEESAPAVETEGEEEEAGQESHEEKGERAEGEGKSIETEVEKDVEEEVIESETGGESPAGEAEQMKLEKGESNEEAVEETNTAENPSTEVEEMNSAEEEETPVTEKSAATLEVEPDTTIAEEEALAEDTSVVAEQEAPAVTTRTLRSRTKSSHASRRSGRHKDQVVSKIQQQEEEKPEEEKTQEVIQLTDDSSENREEPNAKEQAETKETSPTGKEAEPPARDATEDQAEETADSVYDRVIEPADQEPATEETESPEEELSESKEDKTVGSSESKSFRSRAKTVGDKEDDKAEEIKPPKRRSIRKRPRVDYRENEEEEGDMEVAINEEEEDNLESDEPQDIKEAECPADEQIGKLGESNQEENFENNMGANESTSEKGDILNLVIDTDEEVEKAGMSQEDEEDDQNMSEEEVEPIVIGKRVLRGRSVPSVIITPGSKSKRCSAKVQRAESLSDEESEKSPQSAQRSLRKRKGSEVTPTRKSKRHSRV